MDQATNGHDPGENDLFIPDNPTSVLRRSTMDRNLQLI